MPPTEHELRLRERLGRLRGLPLLGGAKISGELDLAPDLLVGRLLADPGDLPLKTVELAGDLRAAEQRQSSQPPQPLAQPQLVLSWGH